MLSSKIHTFDSNGLDPSPTCRTSTSPPECLRYRSRCLEFRRRRVSPFRGPADGASGPPPVYTRRLPAYLISPPPSPTTTWRTTTSSIPSTWTTTPPSTPSSNPFTWIAAHRVYDLEDEMDHPLKTATSLAGFDKPSGQANLPTRRSFFLVINPSHPVHFIQEVICKLRPASN